MPLGIRICYGIVKEREGPRVGEKEMSVETVVILRMQYWPYGWISMALLKTFEQPVRDQIILLMSTTREKEDQRHDGYVM